MSVMRSKDPQVAALMKHWQDVVAVYVRERRKGSGKTQKEAPVRQTLSLIERGKLNFTLQALIEALLAVGGNISEAFRAKVPGRFQNLHDQTAHEQLQEILEKAPREAQAWIVGNIKTYYEAYVKARQK